ncbi:MAG: hypothetical protein JWM10_4624 [Myxococcaceae bacterium]|nr:hypothetical protein [Myxococcaceae bacterium]
MNRAPHARGRATPRHPAPLLAVSLVLAACSSEVAGTVVGDAGPSVPTGMPCDVARSLAQNCLSCHGARPARGVSNQLLTREQLLSPSAANPAQSYLQRAIVRMRDATASSMPPNTHLPETDIAPFETWLAAGAPAATCTTDAGVVEVDAEVTPGDDLPCAVQQLLAAECTSCHSSPPRNGAEISLLSRADLLRPSTVQPGVTVAQRSVTRMRAAAMTMPPGGKLPAAAVQPFADWVAAGAPGTRCDAPPVDPFLAPVQCTSMRTWTGGNRESSSMNPGQACIACHGVMRGPFETFAGTVYASGHEPNNCNGAPGAAAERVTVEIRGANGATVRLTPNAVGNFYTRSSLPLPYTARVIVGDRERRMNTPQMDGDCNGCHSQDGASEAPGRIALP